MIGYKIREKFRIRTFGIGSYDTNINMYFENSYLFEGLGIDNYNDDESQMKLKSIRMKSVTPTPAPRSMSPAIRNEIDELKKHAVDSETSKAHFFVSKEIYLFITN